MRVGSTITGRVQAWMLCKSRARPPKGCESAGVQRPAQARAPPPTPRADRFKPRMAIPTRRCREKGCGLVGCYMFASGSPTGAAGGDLAGSYPNPTIATLANVTGTVGGVRKIIRRTADSSTLTSQNTLQADDSLLWSIGATDVWVFTLWLRYNGANTTMDMKCGWSVPASATMMWGPTGGTSNVNNGWGPTTAANSPTMLTESTNQILGTAAGTDCGTILGGYVFGGGNAGTVTLKWSQNTSDTGALKVLANSMLDLLRIA
jgi:hypothetical protein